MRSAKYQSSCRSRTSTSSPNPHSVPKQEPELARLRLGGMGRFGDTRAEYDGEYISVFGGIPSEEVIARTIRYQRRRQRSVSGVVAEVLEPSPHRVAPPCPLFGLCTGCQWQHIDYPSQLELKRETVETELRRYPELSSLAVDQTLPSPQQFGYRNHARFTVRAQGSVGYVNRMTRRFVAVDQCMLMHPWINEALQTLQGKCRETTQVSVRYGVNSGDWLIQPTLQNVDIPMASGQTHYREKLLGRAFRIASPSFFQVNTKQTERLVELVRAGLELDGSELLVDAYAGVGTFAVLFAQHVRRVIAVEESAAAVRDAVVNTDGIRNLEFIEGKTESVLTSLGETPNVVILDPPRVGCHEDALQALIRRPPRRIAYISCDPETLARDLNLLSIGGFEVDAVQPVDMFPQTHHVECLTVLSRPR